MAMLRKNRFVPVPGILRYDAQSGSSTRWNCIVPRGQNGAPLYVRVGQGGAIETSADGESWTSQTSGVSVMLNFVIYDSHTSKYWAVGESGTMLSSADGITWTAVSLPAGVATDNLTGIASNGAGNFVVSNSSSGPRALVSVDSGATWQTHDINSGNGSFVVHFDGTNFIAGRNPLSGNRFMSYSGAANPTGSWTRIEIPTGTEIIFYITDDGVNRIAVGSGGFIATCPLSGSPATANWTVRTSGTTESLRAFVANGCVNFVGQNGISLQSSDSGATIIAGPPVGTTDFLRFGVADPHDPTRALVVGNAGTTLIGQYGLRIRGYETDEEREEDDAKGQSPAFAYADLPIQRIKVDRL